MERQLGSLSDGMLSHSNSHFLPGEGIAGKTSLQGEWAKHDAEEVGAKWKRGTRDDSRPLNDKPPKPIRSRYSVIDENTIISFMIRKCIQSGRATEVEQKERTCVHNSATFCRICISEIRAGDNADYFKSRALILMFITLLETSGAYSISTSL